MERLHPPPPPPTHTHTHTHTYTVTFEALGQIQKNLMIRESGNLGSSNHQLFFNLASYFKIHWWGTPHHFILQKCVVFDELTDIRMYMCVEVDWTRIHQHQKTLYFGPRLEAWNIKFSILFKGAGIENF